MSWPDFRYYSIIVVPNKYWVPFSVGLFVMLMSLSCQASSDIVLTEIDRTVPRYSNDSLLQHVPGGSEENTEDLGQDLVSEPEFNLAPLQYEARVVLTSEHDVQ